MSVHSTWQNRLPSKILSASKLDSNQVVKKLNQVEIRIKWMISTFAEERTTTSNIVFYYRQHTNLVTIKEFWSTRIVLKEEVSGISDKHEN